VTDQQTPATPKNAWYAKWWVLVLGGFVLGLFIGIGIGGSTTTSDEVVAASISTTSTISSVATTMQATTTTSTTQPPTTTTQPPTTTTQVSIGVDDFEITLIEIERKCFGSAGANVQMNTSLAVSDNARNGTGRYLIIYDVDPVEDGPETYNIEIDIDDGTYSVETLRLQTDDCDDEPLATITSVLDN
jgi:hypothetical protein